MSIERSEERSEFVGNRWARVLVAALLVTAPWGIVHPAPALAAENCVTTGQANDAPQSAVPWSQQRIQPERAWPLTTGQGVTVAVIDSGIWAAHAQLRGQVIAGKDLLGPPNGPSTEDCQGEGTQVAGIIAAKSLRGYPLHGVAPGAKLLSIRAFDTSDSPPRGNADTLAKAIMAAVGHASVINISVALPADDAALRDAVDYALAHNVVIVAAAGPEQSDLRPDQVAKAEYWPARYDGVLAVAASDQDDRGAEATHSASHVDIAAPGKDVVTTGANGPQRYAQVTGAPFAAPFVSGTAALIRAYYPNLSAAQVVARIEATADIPAQGRGSSGLGAGIVNPYSAVTAVIPSEGAVATRSPSAKRVSLPAAPLPADHRSRNQALAASGAIGGVTLIVLIGGLTVPRGRARRWQPRRPPRSVGE